MPPKEKKKKKKAKAPAYLADDSHLAPFGVEANQLVRNSLGMTGTVLGVKLDSSGQARLWVKYASGLEAPIEVNSIFIPEGTQPLSILAGLHVSSQAVHVQRTVAQLQEEQAELDMKWNAYRLEQAQLKAAATKKQNRKPTPSQPPVVDLQAVEANTGGDTLVAQGQAPLDVPSSAAA